MPSSSTSPVTTPYWGSSPVVNLAMRTGPSLPAGRAPAAAYPGACGNARTGRLAGPPGRARGARGRLGRAAARASAGRRGAPRRGLPVRLLRAASGGAAPVAPGLRRAAGRGRAVRRAGGVRRPGRGRGGERAAPGLAADPGRDAAPAAGRDRRPDAPAGLLRDARVGDGLPAAPVRSAARLVAAAARRGGHRRRGGAAPDQLLA